MVDAPFDEWEYTQDQLVKVLLALQNHAIDGSAYEGCTCIQKKHLYELELYAQEGALMKMDREKEKQFLLKTAAAAREMRKAIIDDTWEFPTNPFGFTEKEKGSSSLRKKLQSCIEEAEISCCGEHTTDYSACSCNPVAVCRVSIEK